MQGISSKPSNSHGIQAVIFDLAGTLIDFGSCAPAGAFVELFKTYDIEATQAQARVPMGLHKRDHIRAMLDMPELARQWQDQWHQPWTDEDVESLFEAFIPLQLKALPHYSALIPGALEIVTELKAWGLHIGVSTGYNHEMLDMVLNQASSQGLVPDAAVCGADVPAGRPAPWMIFRLMESLDVYPPAAVVKVGDTLADIEAGLNAGVWTVGVTQTGNMLGLSESEFSTLAPDELAERTVEATLKFRQVGAHYVIDGVADLPDIIHQIEDRVV